MSYDNMPTMAEQMRWAAWANERAAERAKRGVVSSRPLKPTAEPHDADWHARNIRRAIEGAGADGFEVDFGWTGYISKMDFHLSIFDKKEVRIWPTQR